MDRDRENQQDQKEELLDQIASQINSHTQLSKKQAKAYIMRVFLDEDNDTIAEALGLSGGGSASSYVTRARKKIRNADVEIESLEDEIDTWKKTEQLEDLIEQEKTLSELERKVTEQLEGDDVYLVRVLKNGEERVQIAYSNPEETINRPVLEYKRITDPVEYFD